MRIVSGLALFLVGAHDRVAGHGVPWYDPSYSANSLTEAHVGN